MSKPRPKPTARPPRLLVVAPRTSPLWLLAGQLGSQGWECRGGTVGGKSGDGVFAIPHVPAAASAAALPSARGFERSVREGEMLLDLLLRSLGEWRPDLLLVDEGFGGGLLLPREFNVPTLVWTRGFTWPSILGATTPAELSGKFDRAFDLLRMWDSTRVLVPSHLALRSLPEGIHGKARVLREPVDCSAWDATLLPDQVRKAAELTGPGRFVVFLGSGDPATAGLPGFLRAMESVWTHEPDVQVLFSGLGDEIRKLPAFEALPQGAFRFLKSVPDSVMAAFYHEAGVVVHGGGGPVPAAFLHAMASHALVCGPDADAFREIVRHRQNGLLFGPGDWGGLADDLLRALTGPAAFVPMRKAARLQMEQFHSPPAAAAAFLRLAAEAVPDYPDQVHVPENAGKVV